MTTTIPSGYSLNRKFSGLEENWSEGESAASRFAAPSGPTADLNAYGVQPTRVSSYSRSVASAANSAP